MASEASTIFHVLLLFGIFVGINVSADGEIRTWEYQRWYNEELIAEKFAPMAAAAYGNSSNIETCLGKVFDDAKLLHYANVTCLGFLTLGIGGKVIECAAFLAIAMSDKAIILSFRGTDDGIQMVDQLFQFLILGPAPPTGSAHSYFLSIFYSLEATGLLDKVMDALEQFPQYELWITGHSLGGALASLVAGRLVMTEGVDKIYGVNEANIKLVTFGQPRVADPTWAKEMDRLIHTYKYRVISANDIVPAVPFDLTVPVTIPFSQTGLGVNDVTFNLGIGQQWLHYTGEVWYDSKEGAAKNAHKKFCNQTNEPSGCSGSTTIIKTLVKHVFGVVEDYAYACGKDYATNLAKDFSKLLSDFGNQAAGIFNSVIKGEKPTFKLPSNMENVMKGCLENKIGGMGFHINEIKGIDWNFMGKHQSNFGTDFKGTGDNGCANKKKIVRN